MNAERQDRRPLKRLCENNSAGIGRGVTPTVRLADLWDASAEPWMFGSRSFSLPLLF